MKPSLRYAANVEAAARAVFDYLATTDPLPAETADAVIGFGMFDVSLGAFCGDLYAQKLARRIIFTGGFGAGSANLDRPEADAWRHELFRTHPHIPRDYVIVENRSTNTAENIAFTADLLAREAPELAFGRGLRTALIVAAPPRLRRVKLTLALRLPSLQVVRCSPSTSFEHEQALHERHGIAYIDHLRGELDRILAYPERGWIISEPLPPAISAAHALLRGAPGNSSSSRP